MGELTNKLMDRVRDWGEGSVLMLPNLGLALVITLLFWFLASLLGKGTGQITGRCRRTRLSTIWSGRASLERSGR